MGWHWWGRVWRRLWVWVWVIRLGKVHWRRTQTEKVRSPRKIPQPQQVTLLKVLQVIRQGPQAWPLIRQEQQRQARLLDALVLHPFQHRHDLLRWLHRQNEARPRSNLLLQWWGQVRPLKKSSGCGLGQKRLWSYSLWWSNWWVCLQYSQGVLKKGILFY